MSVGTNAGQWVRRRCYSKVHVKSWTIFLEKDGYVKCSFQNCKFMAFDVEEMAKHYSLCGGNGSPDAKYVCPSCEGCTVSYAKLQLHMTKAHNMNIDTPEQIILDKNLQSDETINFTEKEKLPLSKVIILSWRCSFEKNKFIKCSDCGILATDVDDLVRHYPDCKKVSIYACYVCDHCMGRAVDIHFLACHMFVAHDININYANYNVISHQMVRFWEDEIKRKKFSYCLHKTDGENDCLFFEMDIISLIFHVQHCKGIKPDDRHVCFYCGCWTMTLEKLKHHIEVSHSDPLGTLIFASETARKQTSSNKPEPEYIIPEYNSEQNPVIKKERNFEGNIISNTGYNLFDELTDAEGSVYCEENENEISQQEDCHEVQLYEGHKAYSSRKSKALFNNSNSLCVAPEINHNYTDERGTSVENINCVEDQVLGLQAINQKHLLPSQQSTEVNIESKKSSLQHLVINEDVYSNNETFGGASQNLGKGEQKEVELIIPENHLGLSNLSKCNSVVLSKLSVVHKDGSFQVIPQSTENETSKLQVHSVLKNKSNGNDIFHLKDGCIVEVTICEREIRSPSNIVNEKDNEEIELNKLRNENIQLELNIVPESIKLSVETNKKHAGTQIDCFDGCNESIEFARNLACVTEISAPINNDNDIKSDKNLFVEKSSYASAKSSSDGITRNQGEKNHNLLETHYQQNNEKTQITLTVMEKATELQNISVHESNKSNLKLPNNSIEDMTKTNLCDPIPNQEKINAGDPNTIKLSKVNITQDLPMEQLKPYPTCNSLVFGQSNFCENSYEIPNEGDQSLELTEPIDCPETNIKDVNLLMITSNQAFTVNKLTNENESLENDPYETKPSQERHQEDKNNISSINILNSLVSENRIMIEPFLPNNISHGIKENVNIALQGDEPTEQELFSEGSSVYMTNVLIMKSNSITVENDSQNEINISKAEGKPTAEPKGVPSQQACHNIKTLIVSGNKAIMKTDEIHKNEEKKTNEMPKELISEGNHIECILKTEVNTREKVPKVSGKINVDEVPLLNGSVDLRDKETTKYLATESKSLIQSQETKSITVVCEINPILYETKKQYPSVTNNLSIIKVQEEEEKHTNEKKEQSVFKELLFQEREKLIDIITPETGQISQILYERQKDNDANETATEKQISDEVNHDNMELVTTSGSQTTVLQKIVGNEAKGADQQLTSESSVNNRKISNKKGKNHQLLTQDLERQNTTSVIEDPVVTHNKPIVQIYKKHRNGGETLQAKTEKVEPENKSKGMMKNIISRFQINEEKDKSGERKCLTKQIICEESKPINKDLISTRFKPPEVKMLEGNVLLSEGCVKDQSKLCINSLQNIEENLTPESTVNILSSGDIDFRLENSLDVLENQNEQINENNKLNIQVVSNCVAETKSISKSITVCKRKRGRPRKEIKKTDSQYPVEFVNDSNSFEIDNSFLSSNKDVTKCSNVEQTISLKNKDKITENSQISDVMSKEKSFEAINSTLSSNTDINVLEVPSVEQSASLSEVTNIDHSETSDSDFQSDTSKIVYPSSPTKKKNSSPRKKIAPTINSKNQKSSDFEIKNNSFVVNSVILSKVDVNVAETSNFEQSLSVSEKQITKQSKTYNDDLEVVAFQTESSLNTRKKRGRPPKKKLKEGSIESLKPKDFESNKKSFVAGNSVSFSNVDVNVAEVLSLTEENMIEHSQTPNSELKTETETEPNGDSIETEKPNDFVSNISLIEKDNSVLFSNRDVNVSKASNTHQTSCLSDIQIIEDHNTSDCDLQSKTSTMKCPSNTKKKRGRPPRKEKLVDSVPDDISSKCSSINNFIPLARSSRTTRKQTSSLNQIDGSNTICNKWYIHPDDSTNQVTIVPRPKRGRPGKTDENSFVHFMVSGEDTPALVTTGIEVAVETTQKPKKIDMRFKCNRLPRIGDAVGPRIQLKDSIMVKCGRCGQEMSKLKYQTSHEIKHNYLCWLEGEEPIDINDESVVLRILTSRRKNKKIAFKCEECGMAKRSAVGFQSHIQFCGKSPEEREAMMQRCEVCGRIMMPASLKVHMGLAHNPKKPLPVEKPEPLTFVKGRRAAASKAELTFQDGNNGEEDDDSDIPTKRRRRSSSPIDDSVKRLYSKPFMRLSNGQIAIWKKHISEKGFGECYSPGCIFVGESIKVLQDHIKDCEYTPKKMYSCRQCQYSTQFEHEVIEHIKEEHEAFLNQEYSCSNSSDSESDSCQTPTTSSKRNYPKLKFIRKLARQQRHRYLHQALTWTYDSHLKMSSTSNLFVELQYKPCDWVPMSHDTAESYLPSTKTSIQLMVNDQDWKQLELFEGMILDGTPAMFVGGPVWACAWAPLPNTETQQYMAVACHPDMDAEHAMGCTYSYKSIIQIWDFGSLCNITAVIVAPYLMLGIAHNHGAVWALEWCESGCFNSFQLGLLAAACSDGSIVIYSIPRHQPSKSNVIYEVNPVAVLKLGCEMLTQCMRIAWHKVTPHNVLAGGFANGMVALWDLTTSSTLLRFDETIFPYCVFQAHNSSITGISFSPGEGARYISTSSADRANKFWDLQDTTAPISVNRKGTVTDSTWLPHWLCSVSIYDDVYGYGSTNMSLFAYRDFFFQPYPLVPQLAVNWSLMQCDWLNSVGTCDETGRVYVSFPLQLIHMDDKKGRKSTQNVILTSIQDFGEVEEVNIPLNNVKPTPKKAKQKGNNKKEGASFLEKSFETNLKQYKEMSSRFGLSLSIDKTMHGLNLVKKEINPANFINSYPLASVNKVSWNPNYKSFLWIAAGFQCGLVVAPCVTYIRQQDLITFYKRNETR